VIFNFFGVIWTSKVFFHQISHLTKRGNKNFLSVQISWPFWPEYLEKSWYHLQEGMQGNAEKFTYSPILKGSRQMLWYL
jgi:hypothetical protein